MNRRDRDVRGIARRPRRHGPGIHKLSRQVLSLHRRRQAF